MQAVKGKFKRFYSRRHQRSYLTQSRPRSRTHVTSIKFDLVSKMHLYSQSCIVSSYKAAGKPKPRIVYSSLPKVMSRVYTKRSVLRKVKTKIGAENL
jgi:hypothetical protein